MPPLPTDHECAWTQAASAHIANLEARVAELEQQLAQQREQQFGPKSERDKTPEGAMPPPEKALRQGQPRDPEKTRAERQKNREKKVQLQTVTTSHPVAPDAAACCPSCKAGPMQELGKPEAQVIFERVPARFVRHEHLVQKMICRRCDHIETAKHDVRRFGQQGQYGASVVADIVVGKIADALPLHRLSARCDREGFRLHRNTMLDLFHRAARELGPLYAALIAQIILRQVVQADETVLKQQKSDSKGQLGNGWMWTFLSDDGEHPLIAYRYSASRSGETPITVLGGTTGVLVVDGYTGYNQVTTPQARSRAACLAHARRKFWKARSTDPVAAAKALALILDVYRVEAQAKEAGIVGTGAHLELRKTDGQKAMDTLLAWAQAERPSHLPPGPMGKAFHYLEGQWPALIKFLDDARVPVDNNRSESALRGVALGRKNFMFVGNEVAGQNAAVLYSLVATCVANDVNPMAWMQDVLLRVQDWPADRVDELLPHRWGRLEEEPTDESLDLEAQKPV